MLELLRAFARNNQWSNVRLYNAVRYLPDSELSAPRCSFFGSIQATLRHILVVDRLYLARLHGQDPDPFNDGDDTLKGVALACAQQQSDRDLVSFCNELDVAGCQRRVSYRGHDGLRTEAVQALLCHLFVHQIHHRGQVHDMLSSTVVSPPQLDEFFLDADLPLRASEIETIERNA